MPGTTYVKSCRGRGRAKKTEQIAKTYSTINQFFGPAQAVARAQRAFLASEAVI